MSDKKEPKFPPRICVRKRELDSLHSFGAGFSALAYSMEGHDHLTESYMSCDEALHLQAKALAEGKRAAFALLEKIYVGDAIGEELLSCCDGKHFKRTLMHGDRVYVLSYVHASEADAAVQGVGTEGGAAMSMAGWNCPVCEMWNGRDTEVCDRKIRGCGYTRSAAKKSEPNPRERSFVESPEGQAAIERLCVEEGWSDAPQREVMPELPVRLFVRRNPLVNNGWDIQAAAVQLYDAVPYVQEIQITQLREEHQKLRDHYNDLYGKHLALIHEKIDDEALSDLYHETLEVFAQHEADCDLWHKSGDVKCSCRLEEYFQRIENALQRRATEKNDKNVTEEE